MEQIVVKKEPEELVDDSEGNISMNYSKPSTSADQKMPSTSGIAIKQEFKEELVYSDNSMDYDVLGVKEVLKAYTDEEDNFDGAEQAELKFQVKEEMFLDKGSDSAVINKEIVTKEENDIKKNPESRNNKLENNDFIYQCKHCSIQFFKKELFERHEERCLTPRVRVGKEKLFQCDTCPKKYQTKRSLLQHTKFVHKKEGLEKLKCHKCEYVTVRKGSFNKHLKIHDKKNYLKCNFCYYIAARLFQLNAHILSKHKLENEEKNKIKITCKIHQCTKCSYSTLNKSNYDSHLKVCLKNVK
ncbi:unnamed protein product [Brassicogethes aeneus]|uniref:C2H2-type domain-containing protein n=1 Tax=Brassicogethes aeneus TaxID=1431903 RepID=A0A9P0BKI7_BRAAE|nr:unnamed protein product [Brassicogethes aeneus]